MPSSCTCVFHIYLKCGAADIYIERDLSFAVSLPKWRQHLGSWLQKFRASRVGGRDLIHWSHHLLLARVHTGRKLELDQSWDRNPDVTSHRVCFCVCATPPNPGLGTMRWIPTLILPFTNSEPKTAPNKGSLYFLAACSPTSRGGNVCCPVPGKRCCKG